jgi:transposase
MLTAPSRWRGRPTPMFGDAFIDTLTARDIIPVIPPKANRKTKRECDFALYRERNLVERFFNKLKHFRAIATRYDKLA